MPVWCEIHGVCHTYIATQLTRCVHVKQHSLPPLLP
eukprot:COSAG01_NODE_51100_length_357_cov_1.550388_1_plen_35_part_01